MTNRPWTPGAPSKSPQLTRDVAAALIKAQPADTSSGASRQALTGPAISKRA